MRVHGLFWPIHLIGELFYPFSGWIVIGFVQFSVYFLLIVYGCFIALILYRSSQRSKWDLLLSLFGLYGLPSVADARTGGAVFRAIWDFLLVSLGLLNENHPNPWMAVFSILAYAVIGCGLVYLLIRRVPLKD